MKRVWAIAIPVLLIDQVLKIWVKTHMRLKTSLPEATIEGFFKMTFVENEGAAWGMSLGGDWGKLALSIFRLVAIAGIFIYLRKLHKEGAHKGLITAISLVFAGAVGNMIDSAFYGLLFEASHAGGDVARFMGPNGGYQSFLMGSVVDMLEFPLYAGIPPDWIPFIGGKPFTFFDPVFNIADMAISTGVGIILVFQRRFFPKEPKKADSETTTTEAADGQSAT